MSTLGPSDAATDHPEVPRQVRVDRSGTSPAAPADRVIDLPGTIDLDIDRALRPYQVGQVLSSDRDILLARRLHAAVFVARGFLSAEDLAPDGTVGARKDPWPAQSTYFGVLRGDAVVATARQISAGQTALPALSLNGLNSVEIGQLRRLPGDAVVEISALARSRAALSTDVVAVYVRMWQESMQRQHQAWVMAADAPLFRYLRTVLAGRAIRAIGPEQVYLGSRVVPAVIWCDDVGPEHRRLAGSASGARPLHALLPRLFPPAVPASTASS